MSHTQLLVLALIGVCRAQYHGNYTCADGRDVFVQLFEWPWADIEAACPQLAQLGYCAVQVSPPQEHPILENYPWWQRWQAVSYMVTSRAGDETAFRSMVTTCNAVGVRIYVDSIFNHMTGDGSGVGSAGSLWDAGEEGGQSYPGVPYTEADFNGRDMCNTTDMIVGEAQEVHNIRNCRLVGLRDLRLSAPYVRDQVRGYLQKLLDWGVSGFYTSATKNMWPEDLSAILDGLVGDPFVYQEMLDFGDGPIRWSEYRGIGRLAEWKYGILLGEAFKGIGGRQISDLRDIAAIPGFVDPDVATVFVDNQDTQRGHWIDSPDGVLNYKTPLQYEIATAFMLAYDYGYPAVMSSFDFTDGDQSPPSDVDGTTSRVDCGSGEWICEHTWQRILGMVQFHNRVKGLPVANWWDNGANVIAFSRGSEGFIAINNEPDNVNIDVQTGLPGGIYCNVFSCDTNRPPCDGELPGCGSVLVNEDGTSAMTLSNNNTVNSVVAIYN